MSALDRFPPPLLEDIVGSRCIPIVGAGFSRNAILDGQEKMPLWKDLASSIAGVLRPPLLEPTPIEALSAFEYEYSRAKLVEELARLLFVNSAKPGSAHRAFCELPFDVVITTNFDFLLEKAYELLQKPYQPILEEDELVVHRPATCVALLKLHGDLNHPRRLVATEQDYDGFLNQYPLISTYLANLLITRTPLFIGYSLEDPDFRQIYQIVKGRLGALRRPAYALAVEASSTDRARYNRRGVHLISLPGRAQERGEILTDLFQALRRYWAERRPTDSAIVDDSALDKLSLPLDAQSGLCFFAVPMKMTRFYHSVVFPVLRRYGLSPILAEEVVAPGESILVAVNAMISRASFVVAEVESPTTQYELQVAMSRRPCPPVLVVVEEGKDVPYALREMTYIVRPRSAEGLDEFIRSIEMWLLDAQTTWLSNAVAEPFRLLQKKEYRAAVISSFSVLEWVLRELARRKEMPQAPSMRELLKMTASAIPEDLRSRIEEWRTLRNSVVHFNARVSASKAKEVVEGVRRVILNLKEMQAGQGAILEG